MLGSAIIDQVDKGRFFREASHQIASDMFKKMSAKQRKYYDVCVTWSPYSFPINMGETKRAVKY